MPDVILSKLAMAKLSENDAWHCYAEAKSDNWEKSPTFSIMPSSLVAWTYQTATVLVLARGQLRP
jgi:hypothetical protein